MTGIPDTILQFFNVNRRAGHTYLAAHGVVSALTDDRDPVVFVASASSGKFVKDVVHGLLIKRDLGESIRRVRFVNISDDLGPQLFGLSSERPAVFDNHALMTMMQHWLRERADTRNIIHGFEAIVAGLRSVIDRSNYQIWRLKVALNDSVGAPRFRKNGHSWSSNKARKLRRTR